MVLVQGKILPTMCALQDSVAQDVREAAGQLKSGGVPAEMVEHQNQHRLGHSPRRITRNDSALRQHLLTDSPLKAALGGGCRVRVSVQVVEAELLRRWISAGLQ